MRLTIELERATDMTEETWVSHCLEIDCISQGATPLDAIDSLAEAIDMMIRDELKGSGQIENLDWERAFGNISDAVARRDITLEVLPSFETEGPTLKAEVVQLRALTQMLKFHAEENSQLRRLCLDQAEQIADLRVVVDRPRAILPRYRWRSEPPTPDEVTTHQWWWNKSTDGVPHILQLDRDLNSGLIFDAGESALGACPAPFDPSDWPGEWAPCMTPDDVTTRVSRIAEAGKRLVMSHVGKVKDLRAKLALETAALEQARAVNTLAEDRRLGADVDS